MILSHVKSGNITSYSWVGWLAAAVLGGMFIATQPVLVSILVLALLALTLLGAITPLSTLLVMVILAPLRTLVETEATFKIDIGQVAIAALLGLWLIYTIARRQQPLVLARSAVYVPVGLFVAAVSLSALSALSLTAWLTEWLKWVQVVILITLVLNLAGQHRWEWLVFGLVMAGVGNAIIGIYEYFGGSGALHLLVNDRYFRAFGTFGQPNPFGGFMGLLTPVAVTAFLGYSAHTWNNWRIQRTITVSAVLALFYGTASLLMTTGILMSWSRGAWLGLTVAVLVILLALPHHAWRSVSLFLGVVIIAALLWFSGRLPASIVARIQSANEEFFAFEDVRGVDITPANYAVVERLAHWQAALNMIVDQPWLGVGFGNYEVAYPQYRLLNWKFPLGHAHNYYLNIWAEAGIIGFVGYFVLWGGIFWLTWQIRRHPDPLARFIGIGLLGTWAYLSVHSATDNLYVNNLFLHIGVLLGILAVLHQQIGSAVKLRRP